MRLTSPSHDDHGDNGDDHDDVIMDEVGGAASLRRLLNGECCDSSSFFVVGAGGQGILKHISSKVNFKH